MFESAVVITALVLAFPTGCYRPARGWEVFWTYATAIMILGYLAGLGIWASGFLVLFAYGIIGMAAEMVIGNKKADREAAEREAAKREKK